MIRIDLNGCFVRHHVRFLCGIGPIILDSYVTKSGLSEGFSSPRFLDSIKFRFALLSYCRFSVFSLPFLRFESFLKRALNKVVFKEKKKFSGRGMIIAISGADGAGKSSMISGLNQSFSSLQSCFVYTLGKPQGRSIEFIRQLIRSKDRPTNLARNNVVENTDLKRALASVILGFLRLRKARIARAKADNGSLVLADRWPTNNYWKDG